MRLELAEPPQPDGTKSRPRQHKKQTNFWKTSAIPTLSLQQEAAPTAQQNTTSELNLSFGASHNVTVSFAGLGNWVSNKVHGVQLECYALACKHMHVSNKLRPPNTNALQRASVPSDASGLALPLPILMPTGAHMYWFVPDIWYQ